MFSNTFSTLLLFKYFVYDGETKVNHDHGVEMRHKKKKSLFVIDIIV